MDGNGQYNERQALVRQFCLRQTEQNQQVQQALQQAAAALQQAQQLLQADVKFLEELREHGSLEKLKTEDGPQQEEKDSTPPWLLGRTPHLQ